MLFWMDNPVDSLLPGQRKTNQCIHKNLLPEIRVQLTSKSRLKRERDRKGGTVQTVLYRPLGVSLESVEKHVIARWRFFEKKKKWLVFCGHCLS